MKNGRVEELQPVADDIKSRAWVDYADFTRRWAHRHEIGDTARGSDSDRRPHGPARYERRRASPFRDADRERRILPASLRTNGKRSASSVNSAGPTSASLFSRSLPLRTRGDRIALHHPPVLDLAETPRILSNGDLTQRAEIGERRDRRACRGLQHDGGEPREDGHEARAARRRNSRRSSRPSVRARGPSPSASTSSAPSSTTPTTRSTSSTPASGRSPTTSRRSPRRRRRPRRRCWRWWPRSRKSSRHTDTLFNSVEDTASATDADGRRRSTKSIRTSTTSRTS